MSYRFLLFHTDPGAKPEATVRARLTQPETGQGPGPPAPEMEAQKERLAELLIEANPHLEAYRPTAAEDAEPGGTSDTQARVRNRVIELRDTRNGTGVVITLRDDSAAISVPFWYKQDEAGLVVDEIWTYLRILTEQGEMAVYDPQLDQILDLSSDKLAVLKGYTAD